MNGLKCCSCESGYGPWTHHQRTGGRPVTVRARQPGVVCVCVRVVQGNTLFPDVWWEAVNWRFLNISLQHIGADLLEKQCVPMTQEEPGSALDVRSHRRLRQKPLYFKFSLRCVAGPLTCRSQEINAGWRINSSPIHAVSSLCFSCWLFLHFCLSLCSTTPVHLSPLHLQHLPSIFFCPCNVLPLSALERLTLYPGQIWYVFVSTAFFSPPPIYLISFLAFFSLSANGLCVCVVVLSWRCLNLTFIWVRNLTLFVLINPPSLNKDKSSPSLALSLCALISFQIILFFPTMPSSNLTPAFTSVFYSSPDLSLAVSVCLTLAHTVSVSLSQR